MRIAGKKPDREARKNAELNDVRRRGLQVEPVPGEASEELLMKRSVEPQADAQEPSFAALAEGDVAAMVLVQTSDADFPMPFLYAQAPVELASDAATSQSFIVSPQPASLSSAATAASGIAAVSSWSDVIMAIDKIPAWGLLGAVGVAAASKATSGHGVSQPADTTAPTVAVSSNKSALAKGQSAQISFTLSEASTDFSVDDVTVVGGSLSNFSGSGKNYTATFTPAVNSTAPASVSVGSGKFSDTAGNLNADGADANNKASMSVDTVAPLVPVVQLDGSWTANPQVTLGVDLGNGTPQEVVVEVYPNVASGSVSNWLAYVDSGFYSGLVFHRVIPNFVVQSGGFTPDLLQVQPLYSPIALETTQTTGLSNLTGTLAMARTSAADSATSQFYINVADNTSLDYSSATSPGYAVFGKVVSGMQTVNAMVSRPTGSVNGMTDVPTSPITLTGAAQTTAGAAYSSTGKLDLSGLESGALVSYSLDGSNDWVNLPTSQTWIDLGASLTSGLHTLAVKQTDSAGNASATATLQFTKYLPDPVHSVLDLLTDTSGGLADGTGVDNITQSTSLAISANLSNAWANQTVWLMDSGKKAVSAVADANGDLSWQGIGAAAGDHVYWLYDPVHQVRIADGNMASSELLVRVV